MSSFLQYFSGLFGGIKSLLTGMRVTWGELWKKKITEQYPENRATLVIPERFRGELVMPHDENNEHACTACGICQMNCPNGTIQVISKSIETEDGKKKKILDQYIYDLGMCTFCNLCVITCPSDAIKFSNSFENSLFTRKKLIQTLNNEGSKLRKKKKEPKPVAAPVAEKVAPKPVATAAIEEPKPEKSIATETTSVKAPVETNEKLTPPSEAKPEDKGKEDKE